MRYLMGLVVINVALALNSHAGLDEASWPPLVRVPPTEKPPLIDGVISPGEWDTAFMGSGITPHRRGGLDPIRAQYWFAYDSDNIYIAARMQTHPEEIFDKPARRLAGGGPNTNFEVLIDPFPCHPDHNWIQAMMYPLGKYKNIGYSQRIGGYIPYEVEWNYAESHVDGWWNIEMSAPVSAFHHGRIKEGEAWGVLYAGKIGSATSPMYYFSGQLGEYFRTRQRYIKMVFDRNAPVVQVRSMGDVLSGKITPEIAVRNTTGQQLDLAVEFAVRDKLTEWTEELARDSSKVSIGVDDEKILTWETATPEEGRICYLFMTLKDGSGKSLYEGIYKIEAPRRPVWAERPVLLTDPVLFEAYLYPYFDRVRAVMDFGGLEDTDAVAVVECVVTDATGAKIASGESGDFDNMAGEIILQLPDNLSEGRYTVTAKIKDGEGKLLAESADFVEKKTFPFEHNTLGISDKVLHPWTPMEVDESANTISVWNRKYVLDDSGFPQQVETAGEQILASPVVVMETINGERLALKGEGVRFTRKADHKIRAEARAVGRRIRAEINLLGEYDGMLKYEMILSGDKDAVIDGLELVIPLRAGNAGFIHAAGDGCRSNISRDLSKERGRVFDSTEVLNWSMPTSWLTYVWLGDYERGLCWWADSAEGWTLPGDKATPVVNVYRRDGGADRGEVVELVFNLIDAPTTVLWRNEEPRRIVFALEATPVRPRPAWARKIGAMLTSNPRFSWVGWTGWTFFGQEKENAPASGNYSFAHLRPINEAAKEELKKRAAHAHEEGKKMLVYTDMRCRSLSHEEPKYYAWEWAVAMGDIRKRGIENAARNANHAISSTRSRIDYDLWCFDLGMELGIDYWYFDEIQNEGQITPATDHGYRDEDGRWMPTGRLFGYRELWKRLYTIMQERGQEEPVIVIHNTSTTYAGPMAFTTATWDFEEGNSNPSSRHLTMFGMGYLVAQSMGHQYGFVGSTLGPLGPEFNFESWLKDYPEEAEGAARHWMGVHMLLDMNPYLVSPYAKNNQPVVVGMKMLGEFGWNQPDCEWAPYWKAEKENLYSVKPAPESNVYVSMYRRPGKALVIVLNDANEPVTVSWKPSPVLGVVKVFDAEDESAEIKAVDGAFDVDVRHFNYRALLVEMK